MGQHQIGILEYPGTLKDPEAMRGKDQLQRFLGK